LGPLLLIVGLLALALPGIAAGFGIIKVAMIAMTGPVGLVIALIASIVLFMSTSEKARQVVGAAIFNIVGFFQSMGTVVGDVLFKIVTIAESAGSLIGAALGKIGDFIAPMVSFIDDLIVGVIDRVKSVLNFLGGVFAKFKGFAASIGLIELPEATISIDQDSLKELELANGGNIPTVAAQSPIVTATPAVARASANATVNGQITVSASPGSQIDDVQSQNPFAGPQSNIGLNVAQ